MAMAACLAEIMPLATIYYWLITEAVFPRISDLSADGPSLANDYQGYFDVRNNVYYNWSGSGQGAYGELTQNLIW